MEKANPYISQFIDKLSQEDKSQYTLKSYRYDLQIFEAWLQRRAQILTPESISFDTIREYRSYLIKKLKSKPATVNRKLVTISKFCKWAVSQGHLQADPSTEVKSVRKTQLSPKSLVEKDLRAFLSVVYGSKNTRDIAIAELLANTGIRVGELAALTIADIDKASITVRWGKGRDSRVLPLNAAARQALANYLKTRTSKACSGQSRSEHREKPSDSLFIGQRGEGLKQWGIWKIINKYGTQSGVKLSPHTLRHTFGRKLIKKQGVDIVTVQSMLGHKNINTTAIYTLPSQHDLEKAVEELPELSVKFKKKTKQN
jgi:site-specific recombinase XerD